MTQMKNSLSRRNITIGGIFSCLLSFVFLLGWKINYDNKSQLIAPFQPCDIIWFLLLAVVILILYVAVFCALEGVKDCPKKEFRKRNIVLLSGVLLICWLPYYLTYFPANLSADSLSSIRQALDIVPLYNHHPVCYTLFLKLFIRIGMLFGDVTTGVGLAMFVQMTVMAFVLGYFLWWSYRKGIPKWLFVCFVLFFAINPVIGIYAMTMWKDVLFSGWILLLCLFLLDTVDSNGACLFQKKGYVTLAFLSFLVCFGRNNGIFIVVLSFIVLCIVFRSKWKKCLPIMLGIILTVEIIQGPLYGALHIENSGFAESVAIPIQQIGYTVWSGATLTNEKSDELSKIVSPETIKKYYDPKLVDALKFNKEFHAEYLNENKGAFLRLWLSLLPSHFGDYVTGYLLQTSGYWNPGTSYRVCRYGVIPNEFGVQGKNMTTKNFYQLMLPEKIQAVPVVGNIYNIGYMVWLCIFVCFMLVSKGKGRRILCLCPLLALWGTMMIAAPLYCDFRYMYAFHLAIPLMVVLLYKKELTSTANLWYTSTNKRE